MAEQSVDGDKQDTPAVNYGFYGRLSSTFPSQIVVDVTEVCNLACIHCPHPEFKQSEFYNARYLDPELNVKLVDEVREHGAGVTQFIRYTSEGEPLIHPKGYDIIDYAVRNSGTYVTITTNGTIMDEKRTRKLLDAGIHMVDISIDAHTPETYARVRVNGDLEVTRSNVLRLIEWIRKSGSPTKVVVSFVDQPENHHEADDFKQFWEDQGANCVVIRRLHSSAGAMQSLADAMHRRNEGEARRPCLYPWERIILNPRGYLAFCPVDWTNESKIIDYHKTTIREAWQGEFYQGLRRAHMCNDFSNHEFCGQCPDWELTRWPQQGRSYADMIEDFNK